MAATDACNEGDDLCRYVANLTDNEWLARASNWLIAKPAAILTLVFFGVVIRWILHRAIDRLTKRAALGTVPGVIARGKVPQMFLEHNAALAERRQQRSETMGGLLKSITTGVIFTIVAFMVIAQLGYNIGPLIASAGIIGVALGFGAQSLVKDFLSGIFMILEDQYGVGDSITVGDDQRHRRGGRPPGHAASRRQRHGLVPAQRRGPCGRQHEPELGSHRARHPGGVLGGPDSGARTAARGRPELWEDPEYRCRHPRGARGLGRRAVGPRRRRHPSGAQDRAAATVDGRTRDARTDQGPLRRRRHRDPAPAAHGLAPRRTRRNVRANPDERADEGQRQDASRG